MEANMSPNLSAAHFPPNQLLYEQVLYNSLKMAGLAHPQQNGTCSGYAIKLLNTCTCNYNHPLLKPDLQNCHRKPNDGRQ